MFTLIGYIFIFWICTRVWECLIRRFNSSRKCTSSKNIFLGHFFEKIQFDENDEFNVVK